MTTPHPLIKARFEDALTQWQHTCAALGIPVRVERSPRMPTSAWVVLLWEQAPGIKGSHTGTPARAYVDGAWSLLDMHSEAHHFFLRSPEEIRQWLSQTYAALVVRYTEPTQGGAP